ncbi:AAA family ATPase [Mycobacterium sp. 1274756.6]|uniref:ATP-binding protein n=1 Tax=Mycobacterium sp. 1274756.6 TaxID=1834076 RepID=UPI00336A1D4F
MTVLFADVVRSMDLAAAVGAERLREIMTGLFGRCAAVVRRYGGTVDKFTGDGIMAVFGAPMMLEDHAYRACLAALEMQAARDVGLQLRVGLNSGQVVAGEIGPGSYTAIGEQVGLAQRMESVAPPGGIMLSESTARLVAEIATLGEPEQVHIKGVVEPVPAYRLLAGSPDGRRTGRQDPALVGRAWELSALTGMLDAATGGSGCVVGVVGPAGIGKSRLAREVVTVARRHHVDVFATYCEAHAREIPFSTVVPLLRTAFGLDQLGHAAARARIRERAPDADPQDLLLLDDLLGIAESGTELPAIDPDARRRRLTRLVNTLSLARATPAMFVIEDVHWIDDVSELLLADFLAVIPQTPSLVLITYRTEYRGVLTRAPNSQTISLGPLTTSQSATLATELIGRHPSAAALAAQVAERAAGNPFFAEELVRDLAERGVLAGSRGSYIGRADHRHAVVPATVQATIGARIDRLEVAAKQTLNAAAVIGLRFSAEQLSFLDDRPQIEALLDAELIDQFRFTPHAEYAFHHPLIRTVAYESQLQSTRAELHRRLALAIQRGQPDSVDENAALIAEHLEAAGDLPAAFDWHMRSGGWAQYRDVRAARLSWERARMVADRLPIDDPDRIAKGIGPRILLCGSTWRVSGTISETGFDELRDLASAAGDQVSLALAMAGLATVMTFHNRFREAAQVSAECAGLLESIHDPALTVALSVALSNGLWQSGQVADSLRLAQRAIDWAEGDATKGNLTVGSPLALALALRGSSRYCLGLPGWRKDLDHAIEMARRIDPTSYAAAESWKYGFPLHIGVSLPDQVADRETAEALQLADRAGDDFAVDGATICRGLFLIRRGGDHRDAGFALLSRWRDGQLKHGYGQNVVRTADIEIAREKARTGEVDDAVDLARAAVDYLFDSGEMITRGEATRVFVEALLLRGATADLAEAQAAINRLAAVPTDPGFVLFEVPLLRLRALLARAKGEEAGYRDLAARYLARSVAADFQGHIALAETMSGQH